MTICAELTREQCNDLYDDVLEDHDVEAMRRLCCEDLFFLLTRACNRKDIDRQWLFERCREVEADPDGHLDLWAREHYKSTIITFGLTIQEVLNNPNITIGIFSHSRNISKKFLRQIMREFEDNTMLQGLFPEILWTNPKSEAPKWSEDHGIIVKRSENPKEATIEAWGVVDSQPTSAHFELLVYDDVVEETSVNTPDQIEKTTRMWALSLNLGKEGGRRRYIGTRYHYNDTYRHLMKIGEAIPRLHPATDDGTPTGKPVFVSQETLDTKRRADSFIFACQMLLNPIADDAQAFMKDWLMYYEREKFRDKDGKYAFPRGWNYYLLCDPAGEKKKTNDYTVMLVIALADDNNYYLIDGIRSRMNLTERATKYIEFHKKYQPHHSGYEKYGKDSDIEHIISEQNRINYRFNIIALGGQTPKNDRIRKLIPIFEARRFFLPYRLLYRDVRSEGQLVKARDLVHDFVEEEYLAFPVAPHDDMMDCAARIVDPKLCAVFPVQKEMLIEHEIGKVDYQDYHPLR